MKVPDQPSDGVRRFDPLLKVFASGTLQRTLKKCLYIRLTFISKFQNFKVPHLDNKLIKYSKTVLVFAFYPISYGC